MKDEVVTSKNVTQLVKSTYQNWRNDRTLRLGAGLSYYVVFSLIPILALSLFFASLVFPEEEVLDFVRDWAIGIFGTNATEVTEYFSQQELVDVIERSITSLGLFGLGALIVTASFAMVALMDSVNIIWGRPVVKGWKHMVKRYAFSYIAVLSVSLFLIILLTVQAMLSFVEEALEIDGFIFDILTNTFTMVAVWGAVVLAVAWLMRTLSGRRVEWNYSIVGSAATVLFMYLGVKVIGFYLGNYSYLSVTSAFGTAFFILAWVYYEAQILLAGFQLTKTMSEKKYFSHTG